MANSISASQSNPDQPTFAVCKCSENPSGPHQIVVSKSDANSTRWPTLGPVTDSKGAECQWALSPDKAKSRWLSSLGKCLAEILGLTKNGLKEDWTLKDFPADYRLYTYIKGTREDQYLFGSTHVYKFRTANEFLPHLQWLVSNEAMGCLCKYCSGAKNQFEVNAALGLPNSASKSKPDGSQPSERPKRQKRSRSPTANNQVSSSYKFQGPFLNEELNRDLLENRSNFRKHELVWCLVADLKVGISTELSRNSQEIGIKYWPGLCQEPTLCNETRAFIAITDDEKDCNGDSSEIRNPLKRKLDQVQPSPSKPASNELENQQRFKWNIRLLGLSDIVIREEKQILPWLFKTADLKQKFGMTKNQAFRLPPHIQNSHHTMRPMLDSFTNIEETLVAFQLAIQIAGNLEEFWGAHDRYDASPDSEVSEKPGSSHRASQTQAGVDLPTTWFQGIWWGAEKIWLYDLVRLNEFKSVPSLKAKAQATNSESASMTSKPGEDCYFLKIEGIYRDELGKKLIVMGKIFDLLPTQKSPVIPPSSSPSLINTEKQRCSRPKKWMPDPPPGFKFRQITKAKEMSYLHVECIAGRYYSPTRKNSSDKLSDICRRLTAKLSQESEKFPSHSTLVSPNASLFGLTPGQKNFMRCRKWRPTRADSISDAESIAEQDLIAMYEKLKSTRMSRNVSHNDENHFNKRTLNNHQHKSNANERSRKSTQPDQDRIFVIEVDP